MNLNNAARTAIRRTAFQLVRLTALPKATVLAQVGQLIDQFEVADDTAAVTGQLLELMGNYPIGGKQVHDANIVATMLVYDIPCLLTHNAKDFGRFGDMVTVEGFTD
jgi:hypothetical protein